MKIRTFNIRHTKLQNLNISSFVLQLSLPKPLKPGAKSRMKMGQVMELRLSCYLVLLSNDKPGNKTAAPSRPDPDVVRTAPTGTAPTTSGSGHELQFYCLLRCDLCQSLTVLIPYGHGCRWLGDARSQDISIHAQIAKFMGPTWGPPGSCRPQMGPMLAPWTLLSGWFSLTIPLPEWVGQAQRSMNKHSHLWHSVSFNAFLMKMFSFCCKVIEIYWLRSNWLLTNIV